MRLPVNHAIALAATPLALFAASQAGIGQPAATAVGAATGPAADYPVVVGEPFTIGTTTWTPTNQLNYDAVGQAIIGHALTGVSGAHKTLPLPSYVEVTALDSGRTIVVRLVERGPMTNEALIGLSEQAATQLGLTPGGRAAVRVRRVNPPEVERAALRTGGAAPKRMDTPEALLKVLRRKLAEQSPLLPPPSTPPTMPSSLTTTPTPVASTSNVSPAAPVSSAVTPAPATPDLSELARQVGPVPTLAPPLPPSLNKPSTPAPAASAAKPKAAERKGTHIVQVAAFSTRDRADKAAGQLGGGRVSPAGRFWRLQLGPFESRGQAASALEKAKAAGYSDARIQRSD